MPVPSWLVITGGKYVFKKWLARKAKASLQSATMGTAGGIVGLGLYLQSNPEFLAVLGEYQGVALAIVGVLVAVARLRTAGNSDPE